jgi:microcompartment protein CcmL/EutN
MKPLGYLEVPHITITAIVADIMAKSARIEVLGFEPTGIETIVIRIAGDSAADVTAALEAGEDYSKRLGAESVASSAIQRPDPGMNQLNEGPMVIHPIYGGRVEMRPTDFNPQTLREPMKNKAIGIIETQGLTAVLEATDTMLKSADVTLLGKEKIGAAYVAIMVAGDVAAVEAAVAAGKEAVGELGTVIAAHVIARPHDELIPLLPSIG